MSINNIYTVNYGKGGEVLSLKVKRAIDLGINFFRVNLKTMDRLNKIKSILETINTFVPDQTVGLLIDLPFPWEKIRITGLPESFFMEVDAGEEILFIHESHKNNNLVTKYIFIEADFFKIDFDIYKDFIYGDGEGMFCFSRMVDEYSIFFKAMSKFKVLNSKSLATPILKKCTFTEEQLNELRYLLDKFQQSKICLSFTQSRDDVLEITRLFNIKHERIICKIENKRGIENIDSILDASGGIMIARGDLALDIQLNKFFYYQNYLAEIAKQHNKLLICATDVMLSIVSRLIPTRADIIDMALLCSYKPYGIVYKSVFLDSVNIKHIHETLCQFTNSG